MRLKHSTAFKLRKIMSLHSQRQMKSFSPGMTSRFWCGEKSLRNHEMILFSHQKKCVRSHDYWTCEAFKQVACTSGDWHGGILQSHGGEWQAEHPVTDSVLTLTPWTSGRKENCHLDLQSIFWGNSLDTWQFQTNSTSFKNYHIFPLVVKMHSLIARPFSGNIPHPVRWFESKGNYGLLFRNREFFEIQLLRDSFDRALLSSFSRWHLIWFRFKCTRSTNTLMVSCLLSEDQRASLAF